MVLLGSSRVPFLVTRHFQYWYWYQHNPTSQCYDFVSNFLSTADDGYVLILTFTLKIKLIGNREALNCCIQHVIHSVTAMEISF